MNLPAGPGTHGREYTLAPTVVGPTSLRNFNVSFVGVLFTFEGIMSVGIGIQSIAYREHYNLNFDMFYKALKRPGKELSSSFEVYETPESSWRCAKEMQLQYISSLLCCKTVTVYDITDAQWRKINQKVPKYFFFVMTSIVYYCTHVMLRHAIPLGALLYQHVSLFNYVGLCSRPSPVFFFWLLLQLHTS